MKINASKDPLPKQFVLYIQHLFLSRPEISAQRMHRAVILRWILWSEGNLTNAMPGYTHCPPAGMHGFPAGWSVQRFRSILRSTLALSATHTGQKASSLKTEH